MKQHFRAISTMLCIVAVFSIVLSTAFIINFADHECTGDDCEICFHIYTCEQTLKKLTIGASIGAGIITKRIVSALVSAFCCNVCSSDTLISMKVKLSC